MKSYKYSQSLYKVVLLVVLLTFAPVLVQAWGFFAHQRINRLAVFCLPPEMSGFYKHQILYITENAVNPDRRRYAVEGEAPRHYIDIDVYDHHYGDSAVYKMPRYWKAAVEQFSEDTLMAYGIVPWHINRMKYQLTEAFKRKDAKSILRLSADIGHYIADANVPLHTTVNYNGQLTGQRGIHGFWESRLPELFSDDYNYFVGQAAYVENAQLRAWQAVTEAHEALDSVFRFERELTEAFAANKKYTLEERNGRTIQNYSREFSKAFHEQLDGQVERRMRASVKMVADYWYTAWVDAGQPNLDELIDIKFTKEELKQMKEEKKKWRERKIKGRDHEAYVPLGRHQGCCHNDVFMAFYKGKSLNNHRFFSKR